MPFKHPISLALESQLHPLVNPEHGLKMAAYMKDKFAFLGIKAPLRQNELKLVLKGHSLPPIKEEKALIKELWDAPAREYQYCAIEILERRFKKAIEPTDSVFLEYLITHKSWWDTVDLIASKLAGAYFQKYPNQIEAVAEKWIGDQNMWLNRSAILYQLKYKQATDPYRLFSYCIQWSKSREFFHQKAIGWALREYSKTNPNAVIDFIENHSLPPLSRREGLKWLQTQNKYPKS